MNKEQSADDPSDLIRAKYATVNYFYELPDVASTYRT